MSVLCGYGIDPLESQGSEEVLEKIRDCHTGWGLAADRDRLGRALEQAAHIHLSEAERPRGDPSPPRRRLDPSTQASILQAARCHLASV